MAVAPGLFNWKKAFAIGGANLVKGLDELVLKRYAIKSAETAKPLTPFLTGALRGSLTADKGIQGKTYKKVTGQKVDTLTRLVGSGLPYAAKQEYEHKTKSHFIHKGIQINLIPMQRDAIIVAKKILQNAWLGG